MRCIDKKGDICVNKKKTKMKILSTFLVLSMLLGLVLLPAVTPVANAAEATPTIPSATVEYVNNTFENEADTDGITFDAGNANNIAAVKGDNGYIYLEKNGEENPSITRTLTEDEITPYLVVETALASTNLSAVGLKLTGTAAQSVLQYADVTAAGYIFAGGLDTGKILTEDGTFVTVTVAVNSTNNTYSVWVDGVQVVQDVQIPVENFGNVTAVEIVLNGENAEAANLMVDNLKVYRYAAVYYNNDFSENTGVTYGATNGGTAEYRDGALYLAQSEATHKPNLTVALPDVTYADQIVISMDISSTNYFKFYMYLVDEANRKSGNSVRVDPVASSDDGKLFAVNSPIGNNTLTAGAVYHVDAVINFETAKLGLYLNGTKCTQNVYGTIVDNWDLSLTNFGNLRGLLFTGMGYNVSEGNDGNLTIDNIQVYEGAEPKTFDATKIPEPVETYIDNSFEANDLSGLVLNANNNANKAVVSPANHYLYLEQNDGAGKNKYQPRADYDISFVDSHYIVISMDIATTKGAGDLYVSASDGTKSTINLVRIDPTGLVLIGSAGFSKPTCVPTDGTFSHFDIVIDTETDTFTLWYEGEPCAWVTVKGATVYGLDGSADGSTDFGMLKTLSFTSGWTTDKNSMIDNIRIYCYERPELEFSGASLTLENSLAINFNADPAIFGQGLYTDPVATFNFGGKEITEPLTLDPATGKYTYKFSGIAPNQMGDTITATLSATYIGETYTSEPIEYSVLKYCQNKLTESASSLNTLLVDLLNYGAEAQTATGYNTESLVNAGLTETQKGFATSTAPDLEESDLNTAYATVENPTAVWRSATLVLHDAVTIRLKFQASNVENLTVKIDGVETPFVKADTADTYYVYYNGLHAGQMREVIEATVYNGETAVSNTITYSIASYAVSKKAVTDGNLGNLVVAMMKYGDSAAAFASQN